MGFREIILLGMDCTATREVLKDGTIIENNVVNHMAEIEELSKEEKDVYYNNYKGESYFFLLDDVFAFYRKTKKYADEHGIKIYNATRGGKLEIFERVDLENVLGNC